MEQRGMHKQAHGAKTSLHKGKDETTRDRLHNETQLGTEHSCRQSRRGGNHTGGKTKRGREDRAGMWGEAIAQIKQEEGPRTVMRSTTNPEPSEFNSNTAVTMRRSFICGFPRSFCLLISRKQNKGRWSQDHFFPQFSMSLIISLQGEETSTDTEVKSVTVKVKHPHGADFRV